MKGNIITYCISAQLNWHIKFTNLPKNEKKKKKKPSTNLISISNRFSKCKATKYERKLKERCQCQVQSRYIFFQMCEIFCAFIVAVQYVQCAFFFCLIVLSFWIFLSNFTMCWLQTAAIFDCIAFNRAPCVRNVHIAGQPSEDGAQCLLIFFSFRVSRH